MGCSFSHHDVYVKPNETWPFLLQQDLNCTVINGSIPGNSNLSYFYRLKEMEEKYGKPDKVIVQITGLQRLFFHTKNTQLCDIIQHKNNNYYYDNYKEAYREAGTCFTPTITLNPRRMFFLQKFYGLRKKDVNTYWKYFASDDSLEWLNIKELMLINMYFDNVIVFSWNLEIPLLLKNYTDTINYIGDLKYDIFSNTDFDNYSHIPIKDEHFNAQGHKAVKDFIKKHV